MNSEIKNKIKEKRALLRNLPRMKKEYGRFSTDRYLNCDEPPYLSPKNAIRLRCMDCCGNQYEEVRNCCDYGCSLWIYRLGKSYDRPSKDQWKQRRRYNPTWKEV